MILIGYMVGYVQWLRACQSSRNAYSAKWRLKVKDQPRVTSYHTTKRAQLLTIGVSTELTSHTEVLCTAIEEVISDCHSAVNESYKQKWNKTGYQHRKTSTIEKAFRKARAAVRKASDMVDQLIKKEKRTSAAVDQAADRIAQLNSGSQSNKAKLKKTEGELAKKRVALQTINENIVQARSELEKKQLDYRVAATKIFRGYRKYERERVELIQNTVVKFVQAMHSAEYSTNINTVFANLLANITKEQSTEKDLLFWEKRYGIVDESTAAHDEANVSRPQGEPV